MKIPSNVIITQRDLALLQSEFPDDQIETNLVRYSEWKKGKCIQNDLPLLRRAIEEDWADTSNKEPDTTSTPSVNRNAPQPIPQKRNKGKLSFYLTKETERWWLMEKDGDSEIECYVDFGVAFDNAVNQLTWTGQPIPLESVFVTPEFLPLFKELWQEYDETGEIPEELTKNKFWVWAKDPNSPILKPSNKAKTKRFDWETL